MSELIPVPELDETTLASPEMTASSLSLSALFYVAAINFGAEAINRLGNGASLHNLKYFAGEAIISGLAASKGISHLEDHLSARKANRDDRVPAPSVLPLQ